MTEVTGADAVVVGGGPNGLAAAVILARAGLGVLVLEAAAAPGGGARTTEPLLSGYRHDTCSAVHPSAMDSAFFRAFGLAQRVEMLVPQVSFGHPMGPQTILIHREGAPPDSVKTVAELAAWRHLITRLGAQANAIAELAGGHVLRPPLRPAGMTAMAAGALSTTVLGLGVRDGTASRAAPLAAAALAGCGAHSAADPRSPAFAAVALRLIAQALSVGWPVARGGSQAITDALVADLLQHGGRIETGSPVTRLVDIRAPIVILDVDPRQAATICADQLPDRYRKALLRYRHGPAVFKLDLITSEPLPWRDERLRQVPTVHLAGTAAEVTAAERAVHAGVIPCEPFVLVGQPSVIDDTRAPGTSQVLWAYMHVPVGCQRDLSDQIIARIEQYAPGFTDTIVARQATTPRDFARTNLNHVDGDILGGALSVRGLVRRPVLSSAPWRTPLPGVYLASAATPPGPAVHGMCGWHAARLALADVHALDLPDLSPQPAFEKGPTRAYR